MIVVACVVATPLALLSLGIIFLTTHTGFRSFYIPSAAMEPAIATGDRVVVKTFAVDVERGDIVVFDAPTRVTDWDPDITHLIKRVIALPGETIGARDGEVYVDGERLHEPYLSDGMRTDNFDETVVPEGQVFVLGDNRMASEDSRVFGPIDSDSIVGVVVMRSWPPSRVVFYW